MKTRSPSLIASVTLFVLLSAGEAATQEMSDAQIVAAWKAHVLRPENVARHTDGEDICWLATPYLRGMVAMAEALDGDRECLDAFCKGFEHLMSIASRDIDGLYGWPTKQGTYGQHGLRCIIMDDAMIAEPVAHFAQAVRRDARLKEAYGERAERYLKSVEEEVFPKWQESWLEFGGETTTLRTADGGFQQEEVRFPGPAGVYRYYLPGRKPGTSLPLNQFLIVARAYLAFYDATGKADYLEKARRLAATARHVYLEHNAARTSDQTERFDPWCYWQPVWEGDFKGETEAARWVGPHPERASYHAGEVSILTELRRRGIVFTDEDIRRIVRLHLEVMWNKDLDNPRFSYYYERRKMTYPATLWGSLASFDETIAQMTAPSETREAIASIAGKWNGIGGVPEYFLKQKRSKDRGSAVDKPEFKRSGAGDARREDR